MRRLEFAPAPKDMEVTDIENGRFVFRPRPDKPVSLADLRRMVTKAGYAIEGTWIEVSGALIPDGRLRVPETGEVFRLEGKLPEKADAAGRVTAAGTWKVTDREETILIEEARREEPKP